MKKHFPIVFLFICCQTWSQEYKSPGYQQKMFEKASEYLKNSEYSSAAGVFRYVNELNPNNELGKIALKKSDSLRPISRQKLKESLVGKWRLAETGSNWGMEKTKDTLVNKILVIDENKFWFYKQDIKSNKMTLVKSEVMKFSTSIHESFYSYEFVFSDNQIWNFSRDIKKDTLRLMNTGEEKDEGRTEIVCGNFEMVYTRVVE